MRLKPKPCPFCGSDILMASKTDDGYEIKCRFLIPKNNDTDWDLGGCGGRMITLMPDTFPKGIRTLAQMYKWCEKECFTNWNKRA